MYLIISARSNGTYITTMAETMMLILIDFTKLLTRITTRNEFFTAEIF